MRLGPYPYQTRRPLGNAVDSDGVLMNNVASINSFWRLLGARP